MFAKSKQGCWLLISLLLYLIPLTSGYTKDISDEQRNAYKARLEYNQNKSDYESLLSQISSQEKYLVEQQQKLDQLNAEKVKAKAKLEESKQQLDAKVKALNQVWELRDK